MAEFPRKEAGV